MDMTINALRHRFILQSPVEVADQGGGAGRTWTDIATVWGNLKPLFGREGYRGEKFSSKITHEITLRYRTGVFPSMRLKLGARCFEILATLDKGSGGRWLVCHCEEVDL